MTLTLHCSFCVLLQINPQKRRITKAKKAAFEPKVTSFLTAKIPKPVEAAALYSRYSTVTENSTKVFTFYLTISELFKPHNGTGVTKPSDTVNA